MSINAIYDLMVSDYDDRMMHRIPEADVVVRHEFIRDQCKGKRVLDIGGSGALSDIIRSVAESYIAVDKQGGDIRIDLDRDPVPVLDGIDIVVCGEVVEHLSNPGFFLDGLRKYTVPIIFTVPNACADLSRKWLLKGVENVNRDHVAYYSYYTFKWLLERHGFTVEKFYWHNGRPGLAEGLVFLAR